ncbi:NAD(P)H-quinone oxidoreductase [Anaerolineales bacterium HSG24]|nr:NAD(P)H-quinone oxidoreductase [Anaerolineales bacterium HSG24]
MQAITIQTEQEGHPLVWQTVADPTYQADEVLVDIQATAINRADLFQRAGHYPPPPGASEILGLEMAGQIKAVGVDVTNWQVGDRVCALLPGGGYAELVNVPTDMLMALPDDWSYEQGAAISEVFLTAYVNLFMEANLQAEETVLIHGGGSGVGTAAIQMARQAGCRVFTTAGTAEKVAYCEKLGAELAINYKQADFAKQIQQYTDHKNPVDVILDIVGADYFARNIQLLNLRGRLVFISTLSGAKTQLDLRQLMGRRLRVIGSVLRSRSLVEKVEIKQRFLNQFWPSFLDGTIKPIIDSVYPIQQVNEAHEQIRKNRNIGKIVLKVV